MASKRSHGSKRRGTATARANARTLAGAPASVVAHASSVSRASAGAHGAPPRTLRANKGKLARAKIRHFLFTVAPDRLMRGLLKRRHLECPVELREVTLHVPSWPERLEGVRIAHLSDFHLGELMPIERALPLVERVAKAKPDLLACTGDVVDLDWHGAEPLLQAMGDVHAPLGNYLVLGNHDLLDDPIALSRAATRSGLSVLHGAVKIAGGAASRAGSAASRADGAATRVSGAAPRVAGAELRVGGIDWGRTKRELAKHVHALPEKPDLLLAHNPKAFPAAAKIGIPLTLAGHTHGGQMALPDRTVRSVRLRGLPPLEPVPDADSRVGEQAATEDRKRASLHGHHAAPVNRASRALRRGLYAQGDSRLFVNVGAGSWFPARLNCPAEMLILTVRR